MQFIPYDNHPPDLTTASNGGDVLYQAQLEASQTTRLDMVVLARRRDSGASSTWIVKTLFRCSDVAATQIGKLSLDIIDETDSKGLDLTISLSGLIVTITAVGLLNVTVDWFFEGHFTGLVPGS